MRVLSASLSLFALLHKNHAFSSSLVSIGCINVLVAATLVVPAIGDEQCDASATDASTGGTVCTPQAKDDSNDVIVEDIKNAEEAEHPIWWNYNIDELFEDYFDCGQIIYGYEEVDEPRNDVYDSSYSNANNADDDADADQDSEDDYDDDYQDSEDDDDDFQDSEDDDNDEDVADDHEAAVFQDDKENNKNHGGVRDSKGNQEAKSYTEDSEVVSDAQLLELQRQWATIREKYAKEINLVPIVVHENKSDAPTVNDGGGNNSNINGAEQISSRGVSAMVVPIRIGDAGPGKGRGVFLTEPITKGTMVTNLDNGSTGIFKDGHSWRKFSVSLPRETACNFIEWSWVQTIPPKNEIDNDIRNGLTILIAFDESNLLNSADWDDVEANVRCGSPPRREGGERGPCRFHYYAARDIAAGEELLIDYGEFEDLSQQGWTDIGV